MNTTTDFNTLVEEITRRLRPLAWRNAQAFVDMDVDDFLSIGLEGAAVAYRNTGRTDLPYLCGAARIRIRQAFWRRSQDAIPSISLDGYLYDKDTDRERYIAEDITTPIRESNATIKARVASLLATLPEKHQQVLRARYQLDGAETVEEVCEQYHLTAGNTFHDTAKRALTMCLRNSQRQGVHI